MVTLEVTIDGAVRKFETAAAQASDLHEPLAEFGRHLLKRARERYRAQNFPGLAASTVAHRAQKGLRRLERKLHGDVRKAIKRQGGEAPKRGVLSQLLGGAGPGLVQAATSRGARNRLAVLAAFEARHGRKGAGKVRAQAAGVQLSIKQLVSLGGREDRAVSGAVSRPILGTLPDTLELEVTRETVTLASVTEKKWTDTINRGGTAGHGAKLPARVTIDIDDEDLRVLGDLLVAHNLMPFQEG